MSDIPAQVPKKPVPAYENPEPVVTGQTGKYCNELNGRNYSCGVSAKSGATSHTLKWQGEESAGKITSGVNPVNATCNTSLTIASPQAVLKLEAKQAETRNTQEVQFRQKFFGNLQGWGYYGESGNNPNDLMEAKLAKPFPDYADPMSRSVFNATSSVSAVNPDKTAFSFGATYSTRNFGVTYGYIDAGKKYDLLEVGSNLLRGVKGPAYGAAYGFPLFINEGEKYTDYCTVVFRGSKSRYNNDDKMPYYGAGFKLGSYTALSDPEKRKGKKPKENFLLDFKYEDGYSPYTYGVRTRSGIVSHEAWRPVKAQNYTLQIPTPLKRVSFSDTQTITEYPTAPNLNETSNTVTVSWQVGRGNLSLVHTYSDKRYQSETISYYHPFSQDAFFTLTHTRTSLFPIGRSEPANSTNLNFQMRF